MKRSVMASLRARAQRFRAFGAFDAANSCENRLYALSCDYLAFDDVDRRHLDEPGLREVMFSGGRATCWPKGEYP